MARRPEQRVIEWARGTIKRKEKTPDFFAWRPEDDPGMVYLADGWAMLKVPMYHPIFNTWKLPEIGQEVRWHGPNASLVQPEIRGKEAKDSMLSQLLGKWSNWTNYRQMVPTKFFYHVELDDIMARVFVPTDDVSDEWLPLCFNRLHTDLLSDMQFTLAGYRWFKIPGKVGAPLIACPQKTDEFLFAVMPHDVVVPRWELVPELSIHGYVREG